MLTFAILLVAVLALLSAPRMTDLTSQKPRDFLQDYPTIDQRLPVKAGVVIKTGMMLEWTAGALDLLAGAGAFAGFALEDVTGGAADGDVTCYVRAQGGVRIAVGGGDATTLGIVGVAATVPEATDTDTVRIETGSAITGTLLGKFSRVHTVATGGLVDIAFKGAHLP